MFLYAQQSCIQMQRSMVQSYRSSLSDRLSQRNLRVSHSSLQPPAASQNLYLHKSRIAHLPGSKPLNNQVQFAVVFQCIQIMRLNQQLQILRNKLREGSSKVNQTSYYQIQIKQLMDRCAQLQNQKYSYRQELSQTKDASQNIFNQLTMLRSRYAEVDLRVGQKYKLELNRNQDLSLQIERWKNRYNALQKVKAEQVQSYKKMLDSQKVVMVGRQAQALMQRFQLEKEDMAMRLRDKKQQLEQKTLELKKMTNWYEQAQVRVKEDQAKIEQYQQKVALLSQETVRLGALMKYKQEQAKQRVGQMEMSLKLSRTRQNQQKLLTARIRDLEAQNQQLQIQNQQLSAELRLLRTQINQLRRRVVESQRIQFELKQAKNQSERRFKAMQRKDKRLISLEEEIRNKNQAVGSVAALKEINISFKRDIEQLQSALASRTGQLHSVQEKYMQLSTWGQQHQRTTASKLQQLSLLCESLQKECLSSAQLHQQMAMVQLQLKQARVHLRQKEFKTQCLQRDKSQLQIDLKLYSQQLASQKAQRVNNRQILQSKIYQLAMDKKQFSSQKQMIQQQLMFRNRECMELKGTLQHLVETRGDISQKYTYMVQEMGSLHRRLDTIQKIIGALKVNLANKLKNAHQNTQRIGLIQNKYQRMLQWLQGGVLRRDSSPYLDQLSPRRRDQLSPRRRDELSPGRSPLRQQLQQAPVQILVKYLLLCAQVQSLRKRVGDKQAKVQSMRTIMSTRSISPLPLVGKQPSQKSIYY